MVEKRVGEEACRGLGGGIVGGSGEGWIGDTEAGRANREGDMVMKGGGEVGEV